MMVPSLRPIRQIITLLLVARSTMITAATIGFVSVLTTSTTAPSRLWLPLNLVPCRPLTTKAMNNNPVSATSCLSGPLFLSLGLVHHKDCGHPSRYPFSSSFYSRGYVKSKLQNADRSIITLIPTKRRSSLMLTPSSPVTESSNKIKDKQDKKNDFFGSILSIATRFPLLQIRSKLVATFSFFASAIASLLPSWIRVSYRRFRRRRRVRNNFFRDKYEERRQRGLSGQNSFVDYAHSPRGLTLCLLYIFTYLSLSVTAYSFVFEKWSIVDSLYFAVATFTTVGYGDLIPASIGGKVFTIFFALYGVSILGIALGIIGTNVAEAQEEAFKVARDRTGKRIFRILGSSDANNNATVHIGSTTGAGSSTNRKRGNVNGKAEYNTYLESLNSGILKPSTPSHHHHHEPQSTMHQIRTLFFAQAPNIALIFALTIFMGRKEGWTILSSIYFCIMTTTTVGYGDMAPMSQRMRLFAVFFIPLSVAILGELLSRIVGIFIHNEAIRAEKRFMSRELTMADLAVMDADRSGDVSYDEFLKFMLVTMQKVDVDTFDDIRKLFDSLDVNGSGTIRKKNLLLMGERRKMALNEVRRQDREQKAVEMAAAAASVDSKPELNGTVLTEEKDEGR